MGIGRRVGADDDRRDMGSGHKHKHGRAKRPGDPGLTGGAFGKSECVRNRAEWLRIEAVYERNRKIERGEEIKSFIE